MTTNGHTGDKTTRSTCALYAGRCEGGPRHHGPRCTGIGRNKQGVLLKFFLLGLGTDLPSLVRYAVNAKGNSALTNSSPFGLALVEAATHAFSDMLLHSSHHV